MAVAAKRHNITVLLSTVESNHHHTVIFDRDGSCPKFIEHFHKLVARCVNARRRRKENVWSSHEACVTQLLDYEAVLDKLAYTAANPVKDRLVERAVQWPGLNGYRYLIHRKVLRTHRPKFFFRPDGDMPATADLEFQIPTELGNADEIVAELRERVEAIERTTKIQRAGARVLGIQKILKEDWRLSPPLKHEAEKTIRPRFAGRRSVLVEATIAFREFLMCYREARALWLAGKSCVFPAGTYWMARFTPAVNALAA